MTDLANDHDALDARVRAFMREHDEPDDTVALERVMQLDEMDEPAPQPAALPDAGDVFDSVTRTGVLEEGHRHLFSSTTRRTLPCEPTLSPGGRRNFLASIGGTAEAIGHVAVDDDGPGALEREVQEQAYARNVDWWTAAAAVTGDRGLSQHAPPPEALALDERDRRIRQLARMASVDEYDDQRNHLGAEPDVIGARWSSGLSATRF